MENSLAKRAHAVLRDMHVVLREQQRRRKSMRWSEVTDYVFMGLFAALTVMYLFQDIADGTFHWYLTAFIVFMYARVAAFERQGRRQIEADIRELEAGIARTEALLADMKG